MHACIYVRMYVSMSVPIRVHTQRTTGPRHVARADEAEELQHPVDERRRRHRGHDSDRVQHREAQFQGEAARCVVHGHLPAGDHQQALPDKRRVEAHCDVADPIEPNEQLHGQDWVARVRLAKVSGVEPPLGL